MDWAWKPTLAFALAAIAWNLWGSQSPIRFHLLVLNVLSAMLLVWVGWRRARNRHLALTARARCPGCGFPREVLKLRPGAEPPPGLPPDALLLVCQTASCPKSGGRPAAK
jgi:hypothetical protein